MPAAAIVIPVTLRHNPDGSLRTTNPNGDFNPAPATLAVDLVALRAALGSFVGLLTGGTAISVNLRGAWLTGSDAAVATFGERTIAGDTVSTHNWTVTGSTFAQSLVAGSIGSGTIEIFALDAGSHELSLGQYTWSIAAPVVGTDTLAPTIPTGLVLTPATSALTGTFDASADRFDGTTAPVGVDHYDVFVDGTFKQSVTGIKGPALALAATSIGASSPAASSSQSSGVWTLTAAGVGIHNRPAEECLFLGAALAGDFTITAQLDAYTSAEEFSTSGIMIRETLSQGAIFAALYMQPDTLNHGLQFKRRQTTGGNGLNLASVTGLTTCLARLNRTGDTITALYSTDGINFTQLAQLSLPMASSVQVGLFLSSQDAGVSCTSTIREVNINTLAPVEFTITPLSGTHTVTVRAVDGNGNASAQCPGVAGMPVAPSNTFLFDPGWGMASNTILLNGRTNATAAIQTEMAGLGGSPAAIKRVRLLVTWAHLEPVKATVDSDYNWASLDALVAQAQGFSPARGVVVQLNFGKFNSGTQAPPGLNDFSTIPGYILQNPATYGPAAGFTDTNGYGGYWIQNTGAYCGNFNQAAVQARIVNLIGALGRRYNSNVGFYAVGLCEDSNMVPTPGSGQQGAFMSSLQTLYLALKAAFPNRLVYGQCTFQVTKQQSYDMEEWIIAHGIQPGAADTFGIAAYTTPNSLANLTWGQAAFCGVAAAGITGVSDKRSRGRAMYDVQAPDITTPRTYTPANVNDSMNLIGASDAWWCFLAGSTTPTSSLWSNAKTALAALTLTNNTSPPNMS